MASQAGSTPSGPFTVTASTMVSVSMASNLPFGSGGSDRIASKAHLPTSAPFRVRAAARYPAGYAGQPAEELGSCPGFPSPYGAPAFASWASCSRQRPGPSLPPAYRRRLTALPDPDGVSTFRMRELRPGWVPPRPRGQRCSRGQRRSARPPLAVPPRLGPAPWRSSHLPGPWVTRHQRGFTHVHPSGLPLACAPGWDGRASASAPSSAPRSYPRRTSGRGLTLNTGQELCHRHHRPSNRKLTHSMRPRVARSPPNPPRSAPASSPARLSPGSRGSWSIFGWPRSGQFSDAVDNSQRHSRQIRTKASTEPVALRVRPRPGNTAPTIPKPPTQTHSCIERSEAILTENPMARPPPSNHTPRCQRGLAMRAKVRCAGSRP
jgi:hypothetical protein